MKNYRVKANWQIVLAEVSWLHQENTYLPGYAVENGRDVTRHLSNLEEAKAECIRIKSLSNSVCSGFTKGPTGTYTLRKGAEFLTSPNGAESWLFNDCKYILSLVESCDGPWKLKADFRVFGMCIRRPWNFQTLKFLNPNFIPELLNHKIS